MIRSKLAALSALAMGAVTLVGVNAGPAQADDTCYPGIGCGTIYHYTPDSGLDNAIKIRCDYGDPSTNHLLKEGEGSKKYCKDTDRVYVGDGEEIWCKYLIGSPSDLVYVWMKAKPSSDPNNPGEYMDATGWYKISNVWDDGVGCTKRAD